MSNLTNRFHSAIAAILPLLPLLAIAAFAPEAEASQTCLADTVDISISRSIATVSCKDGRQIRRSIVAGNPKAPNTLDRTPVGKFTITEVVGDMPGQYMQGAAKFSQEPSRPEVGYYIHSVPPGLTGYKARYSIGCIRMNMAGLRYQVGTKVTIGH
jgi:lipoprotein-anchoring transpeptidase ErfK/SrfK